MSIEPTPHAEALIREKVAAGSYRSVDEVIDEALKALEEREQARLVRLRAMVREGFESGEGIPFTQSLMDEIEREAEEAHRRGETPTVDVCPSETPDADPPCPRRRPSSAAFHAPYLGG